MMNEEQIAQNLLRAIGQIEDYAFFFMDLNGHIQSWNLGAEKIKGYQAEEVLGKSITMFYSLKENDANVPINYSKPHNPKEKRS